MDLDFNFTVFGGYFENIQNRPQNPAAISWFKNGIQMTMPLHKGKHLKNLSQ